MNLRAGEQVELDVPFWGRSIEPDERTLQNAAWTFDRATIVGCEWLPPHQRMVVRLRDEAGRDFYLTQRELALNGARQ